MYTLKDFKVGDRIELHPATDLWMRGARYGTIEAIGRKYLTVCVAKLAGRAVYGRVRIAPENIGNISCWS